MTSQTKKKEIKEKISGAICGGVISESKFQSNPWAYMMAFVMPDKWFKKYVATKDKKAREQLFNKYARSIV